MICNKASLTKLLFRLMAILLLCVSFSNAASKSVTMEEKIQALYIAFFNRAADYEGFEFWKSRVAKATQDTEKEMSNPVDDTGTILPFSNTQNLDDSKQNLALLKEIASGFAGHEKFKSTYSYLNNEAFVDAIYKNVLGQKGDIGGLKYWSDLLDNSHPRSDIVASFVESSLAVNVSETSLSQQDKIIAQKRQDLLANKVKIGLLFTNTLANKTNIPKGVSADTTAQYQASIKILEGITEDENSTNKARMCLEKIKNDPNAIDIILNNYAAKEPTPVAENNARQFRVVDGYVKNALLKDSDGQVAVYKGNGLYEFNTAPTGRIFVYGGEFEDSDVKSGFNYIVNTNYNIISPLTHYVSAFPNKKQELLQALNLTPADLNTDFVEKLKSGFADLKFEQMARTAQIFYALELNDLLKNLIHFTSYQDIKNESLKLSKDKANSKELILAADSMPKENLSTAEKHLANLKETLAKTADKGVGIRLDGQWEAIGKTSECSNDKFSKGRVFINYDKAKGYAIKNITDYQIIGGSCKINDFTKDSESRRTNTGNYPNVKYPLPITEFNNAIELSKILTDTETADSLNSQGMGVKLISADKFTNTSKDDYGIYTVTYTRVTNPVRARAGYDTTIQPSTYTFDAGTSLGNSLSYKWTHLGTIVSDEKTFSKNFSSEGVYSYDLTIEDENGKISSDNIKIKVEK